jgi:hypothetical protein
MKLFSIFLMLVTSSSALASNWDVTANCTVATIRGAQACMDRIANKMQDYEEPNEGIVSVDKAKAAKMLQVMSGEEAAQKVLQADFVGAIIEHGDEHVVYYYAIKKGRSKQPEQITATNLVDLIYSGPELLTIEPLDILLGDESQLGGHVYGDIEEAFHEVQEESQD